MTFHTCCDVVAKNKKGEMMPKSTSEFFIAAAVALLLFCSASGAADKHPFGIDDMLKMQRISDPQISPDGKWIVFTVDHADMKKNKYLKDLWLISVDGKNLRRLTNDDNTDYGARWFPDSRRIAFIRVQKESAQVWTMNPFTREMRQATHLPVDADNVGISPDGKWFSFTSDVYPDCRTLACTSEKDKAKGEDPVKAYAFDDLLFRHWDHWEDGKRGHLFVMPVGGGDPVDLTPGLEADIPTRPWGGTEEIAFSPDSREISFVTKAEPNPAIHTNADIFTIDIATREKRCVTCDNKGFDTQPLYSPDGRYLAYLSMERAGYESDKLRVFLMDRKSGEKKDLSEKWDRSPTAISWSPDSRTIYAAASDEGVDPIFAVDVGTGSFSKIIADHQNGNATATRDRLVFLQNSFTYPSEIFTSKPDGSDMRQITEFNKQALAQVAMSEPEKFRYKGAGGDMIQGWFMKPTGFKDGMNYPLAYFIHGGPQWPWNDMFHFRWNMEIAAGLGYAAATVNFHGSPGFGREFTDSIRRDWGGKPYVDIMKGLDYVLKSNEWIDAGRMCALGASYGGYMTNWIAGHTDRFACLVTHDGEFSTSSAFYGTEELWFPEWDIGGTPYDNPENYEKWSPDRFVKNWKTPTLVIHGAKDFRVVDVEGLSTFTALRRQGVPARLLYFPDENHWVIKPLNSKRWHDEVYGWLDRWTKK